MAFTDRSRGEGHFSQKKVGVKIPIEKTDKD